MKEEIKEIKKDGYDENSNEYKVTVKEVEDKNNKIYDDNGTAYNGKKAEISINPLLDTTNNNNSTLYNTPEKGTVTLTKVMNNNDTGLTGIDDKTLAEIVDNAAQTAIKAKVEKTYTKEAIEAIFALAK